MLPPGMSQLLQVMVEISMAVEATEILKGGQCDDTDGSVDGHVVIMVAVAREDGCWTIMCCAHACIVCHNLYGQKRFVGNLLRGPLFTFEFVVVLVLCDTYPLLPNICTCAGLHMVPLCAKHCGPVIGDCIRSRKLGTGFKRVSQTRKSLSTRLCKPKNAFTKNLDWNTAIKTKLPSDSRFNLQI